MIREAGETDLARARQLLASRKPDAALALLEQSLAASTSVGPAHPLHLQALLMLDRQGEALKVLQHATGLAIETADAADALAFFARQLDQHELSNRLYRRALDLAPEDARFWYNFATSERTLGHLASAAEAADKACQIDPQMKGALLLRSEVTRATSSDNNVQELSALLSRPAGIEDEILLSYALGKELHDLRQYDEAFAAFARGAAARRRSLNYDVAQDELKLRRIEEAFADCPAAAPVADRPARHIFIVGLPRSGTTLTERILGALPGVRSNNETNNLGAALMRHSAREGGDVFERAAHADFAAVGREYEALAASDGFAGSIIEKLPFNYLYVGAILSAIPDAAIVVLRRDPMDSCFAMFRTLFAAAYPFSYSFEDLARYFAAYQRLMRHWEKLFPGRLITVDYEELVRAPGEVAPGIARRCGLDWIDDALDLNRNRSASMTASAAQVRGEIYTSSAGGWRHYRHHLDPLADALTANGVELKRD